MNRRLSTVRCSLSTGFTLVELLVAIGIFSVIMTLSAGAYLIMIGVSQRAQGVALAADNLAFVFENMTRSIRTGSGYSCSGGDCSGGASFSFISASGESITYSFVPPAGDTKGYVRQMVDGTPLSLTDPGVNITSLAFHLSGSAGTGAGDYHQPFLRVTVAGSVDVGHGENFSFSMETASVMRNLDL